MELQSPLFFRLAEVARPQAPHLGTVHLRLHALALWVAVFPTHFLFSSFWTLLDPSGSLPVHPPLTAYHQNQYKGHRWGPISQACNKTGYGTFILCPSLLASRAKCWLTVGLPSSRYVTHPWGTGQGQSISGLQRSLCSLPERMVLELLLAGFV